MANKELLRMIAFADGKGLKNTLKAAYLANELHDGQERKDGGPYISHPARVANSLKARKINDDIILATALLHDVLEDCNVTEEELIHKIL